MPLQDRGPTLTAALLLLQLLRWVWMQFQVILCWTCSIIQELAAGLQGEAGAASCIIRQIIYLPNNTCGKTGLRKGKRLTGWCGKTGRCCSGSATCSSWGDPGGESEKAWGGLPGWLGCFCRLPALSSLGFSLRRHAAYSSLMVRAKQEHLLMRR